MNNGSGVAVLFDESKLREQMAFVCEENPKEILEHAFLSLGAHGLLSGGHRHFRRQKSEIDGRFCYLSLRGVELFCWGNGQSAGGSLDYFSGRVKNEVTDRVAVEPLAIELGMVSWA